MRCRNLPYLFGNFKILVFNPGEDSLENNQSQSLDTYKSSLWLVLLVDRGVVTLLLLFHEAGEACGVDDLGSDDETGPPFK